MLYPILPVFKIWRGNNLTTSWNRPGSKPRSFRVELEPDTNKLTDFQRGPLQETKGSVYDGQTFTVRNGRFNLIDKTVRFDMIFDGSHPPETFEGNLEMPDSQGVTSIQGTIKVKSTWLQGKPPNVYGPYSRYRAHVTLH
ncbi:hypothetical protein CVT26_005428 [Gymnopilus dilepis]|uniref:Uncharacterized protein n=1 Tax=Gymnopilus dilepis TaxID=231916 RepID=A0A409W8G9_9AGAR|nr:hypothetical protein CVT26_005428 [Gymnopilus dilepis]